MPELGKAWVTLAVSTRGVERDIRSAFRSAEKSAKLSPDVDTTKMSGKADAAGREFGSRFSSGAKSGLAALGIAGAAATVFDQFKQVMSVGMDYTKNMNMLQAVTSASADEMLRAGAAAKALGVDASLPATSVNDAATAMTELAKSGLDVQQSMDAARGTLQLATAAGVSAQQAAVIQGDAINTFQLGADQANKVADLLAGAANASSGEITDFASGLAQAGSVAAGFGVGIEDTVTSLAMFAKFGVKGSDAGTMMKTSLQSLTDGSKLAQTAIAELGLKVYDAKGVFVGYPQMLKQVAEAQSKMNLTDEQFQGATNKLFGSDAMRAAMVAANGGAAAFDGLREKVTAVGNAARMSEAKTEGLPGAWERIKSAIEGVQLQAYTLVETPITGFLNKLSDGIGNIGKVGESGAFQSIAEAFKSAGPGIKDIGIALGKAAGAIGVAAWSALSAALSGVAGVLKVLAPLLNAVGSFMRDNQGLVTAFVGAFAGFKLLPGLLGKVSNAFLPLSSAIGGIPGKAKGMRDGIANAADSWKTMTTYMQQANPQMTTAQARMANVRSTASGMASGVKTAFGGLVGALGGPLNIALMGATVAFGLIASKNAEATAAVEGYAAATRQSATDQQSLNDALIKSAGLMDDAAKAAAVKRIADAKGELEAGSKSPTSFLDQFRNESGSLLGGITNWDAGTLGEKQDQIARTAGEAKAAIDSLKLSEEQLTAQVTGSDSGFAALTGALEQQGAGGAVAAAKLAEVRTAILGAQAAGATAGPVLAKLGGDAVQSAANIRTAFAALPTNVPINVEAPGGQATYDLLQQLGVQVDTNNDKNIVVTAPMAPEVLATLEALGIKVSTNNDKTITVTQTGAEAAGAAIDQASRDRQATINVITNTAAAGIDAGGQIGIAPRADGGIVPMANGGVRMIGKPQQADIYEGKGAGTLFAEEETGGEAYIPLAPGKRERSTSILAGVAQMFGLQLSAPGGGTGELVSGMSSSVTSPIVDALGNITSGAAVQDAATATSNAGAAVLTAQSRVTSAQARLDAAIAAVSKAAAAGADTAVLEQDRVAAEQALAGAEKRLEEVKGKGTSSGKGNMDGSSLGQSIVGGMLQSIGLDGSVFSNPMEWPMFKSVMAGVNYGGELLQGMDGFLKPLPNGAMQPSAPDGPHPGTGAAPGPAVVVNGDVGMDPRQFTQRVDAAQNQSVRRNLSAVRPQ